MKQIGISMSLLAMAVSAYSQGQVNFNNRVVGTVVAPIYGSNPTDPLRTQHGNATTNGGTINYTGYPLLAGTGFTAALFGGAPGSQPDTFTIYGSPTAPNGLTFRTGAASGFVNNVAAAVPIPASLVPADGSIVQFQVRAWDNVGGTIGTWAAAMAVPSVARGASDTFNLNLAVSPPGPVGNLAGLTSFNIAPVPEPGVIALGVLGLGALLLRRRK
jgi:hypothetical protein